MKIIGLTRIRNEEEIIQDTLDHMAEFCSGGIYVYDDASTDNTLQIVKQHPHVLGYIQGKKWDSNRERAEFENRQELLELGQKNAQDDDWFIYMDADERIDFKWEKLSLMHKNTIGIRMRLFDYYITENDKNLNYTHRKYIGPEYRDILMLFKNTAYLKYYRPDQREVYIGNRGIIETCGYVKHYGKAISIQQWEDTCDYYADKFPKYSEKWEKRKGKAVHTMSDFGHPLITWEEKTKGIPLYKIELRQKDFFTRNTSKLLRGFRIWKEKINNLYYYYF